MFSFRAITGSNYYKLNRSFIFCFIISASVSAAVAQSLAEHETYINTTFTIISGYLVFFTIFGAMFYFDNKKRYKKMTKKMIKNEIIKLTTTLGIGELVYISIRWTTQFYFLELNFEPYVASLVSEVISTSIYMIIVTCTLRLAKMYH